MRLSQRISKIPIGLLYGILAFYTIWDLVFTYVSITTNPNARESNPFHIFFINLIGPKYLLLVIPFALVLLYIGIKIGGRFITKNSKKIRGENHVALLIILIMSMNIFNQFSQVLFDKRIFRGGFSLFYPIALVIIIAYCLWIDYEVKKLEKS